MSSRTAAGDPVDITSEILESWDGQNVIDQTERLCTISSSHNAYRVSGSEGANEAADLIRDQFQDYGLQVHEESFDLPIWNLLSSPTMFYDIDGNISTTEDALELESFNADGYSMPTPVDGALYELVTLPLPHISYSSEVGGMPIDRDTWNSINTTGKVLMMGREVRWSPNWEQVFKEKLESEPPVAIIFFYWYSWMSYAEEYSQSSTGGRPLGIVGPVFWDLNIAVGSLNYTQGHMLKELAHNNSELRVSIEIRSRITEGQHRNIIADIPSSSGSSQYVILGAHYDTVMCEGYIDNSASVATLLEIGRMVQQAMDSGKFEMQHGLRIIAFAGEELGLAGSINYVNAHRDEMADIVSALIVDCIGSQTLQVTDPGPSGDFDLSSLADIAAQQLNSSYVVEDITGSDHSSFLNPAGVAETYNWYWQEDLDLHGVQGVVSSMLFCSYPITIYESSTGSIRGHIHTPSDSISGVQDTDWINKDQLQDQAELVALTTLYAIDIRSLDQGWDWIYLMPIMMVAIIVCGYIIFRQVQRHRP